jgi:hypothetical protein
MYTTKNKNVKDFLKKNKDNCTHIFFFVILGNSG